MKANTSPHPLADFWRLPPEASVSRALAAKVLHKSVSWMERKALSGDGPAFRKLGRHALYSKQDLLDYIESTASRRVRSTSELQAREVRHG